MIAVVTGAAGFIGGHLCRRLKQNGYFVRGVDIVPPRYGELGIDSFSIRDLRDPLAAYGAMAEADIAYCLAANMGGMGFIGLAENQFDILHDNAVINLNCAKAAGQHGVGKVFYSSSACVYPEGLQMEIDAPPLKESDAYPAMPDTEYGWEKLLSERAYALAAQHYGFEVYIARFHNVYGPNGAWNDGREKAPAALCRKVAEAKHRGANRIDIWGDGMQTRSFCYIEDCLDQIQALVASDWHEPLNIGTDFGISIRSLANVIMDIAGHDVWLTYDMTKPQGVRGRNADLTLMRQVLGIDVQWSLREGLKETYAWIEEQVRA